MSEKTTGDAAAERAREERGRARARFAAHARLGDLDVQPRLLGLGVLARRGLDVEAGEVARGGLVLLGLEEVREELLAERLVALLERDDLRLQPRDRRDRDALVRLARLEAREAVDEVLDDLAARERSAESAPRLKSLARFVSRADRGGSADRGKAGDATRGEGKGGGRRSRATVRRAPVAR